MPRNNRKPEIVSALAKGGDPIKVADDFGVTRSYVYHLDKKRREGFGAIANNKTSADVKLPGGSLFKELSVSSLKRHGGDVDEEYLRELRGQQGVQLYKEMGNHPVIAAVLQAIKMTLRRVQWYAVPPKSGREEEVDFLNQCMEDMSHTFADYVDQILSMLQLGHRLFGTDNGTFRSQSRKWCCSAPPLRRITQRVARFFGPCIPRGTTPRTLKR